MTNAELLVQIDTAITKVLSAQEYSILGRRWRGADLPELRAWRKEVVQAIALETARAARGGALGYVVPIP